MYKARQEINWAFKSSTWDLLKLSENATALKQSERQKGDSEFAMFLNRLRCGFLRNEDLQWMVDKMSLNQQEDGVLLACKNETVDKENSSFLERASKETRDPSEYRTFEVQIEDHGDVSQRIRNQIRNDTFGLKRYSEEEAKASTTGCFMWNLRVFVGAALMVTVNVDVGKGITNGMRGTVKSFTDDEITLYCDSDGSNKVITRYERGWSGFSIRQFPLRYATAITVHKSQSLTLRSGTFDWSEVFQKKGQVYTALSRFSSLENLHVLGTPKLSDLQVDPEVMKFCKRIGDWPLPLDPSPDGVIPVSQINVNENCYLRLKHISSKGYPQYEGLWNHTFQCVAANSSSNFITFFGRHLPKEKVVDQCVTLKVTKLEPSKVPKGENFSRFEIKSATIISSEDLPSCTPISKLDDMKEKTGRVKCIGTVIMQASGQNASSTVKLRLENKKHVEIKMNFGANFRLNEGRRYLFIDLRRASDGKIHADQATFAREYRNVKRAQEDTVMSLTPELKLLHDEGVFIETLRCSSECKAFIDMRSTGKVKTS